eukprot:jgi/Tetstr1/444796/TSEL_032644.t1
MNSCQGKGTGTVRPRRRAAVAAAAALPLRSQQRQAGPKPDSWLVYRVRVPDDRTGILSSAATGVGILRTPSA